MSSIQIEIDTELHAAYIRLSENAVASTVEAAPDVLVDLDEMNVAVGIEVLDETAHLPFADLVTRYHVHTGVIDLLRLIRPDVSSYLELTRGNDGTTASRPTSTLAPA